MKSVYSIFVEGVADKRFIGQLIESVLGEKPDDSCIIKTDGWTNLMSHGKQGSYINLMKRTTADGGVNLVIFDADDDFKEKASFLTNWKGENSVEFELFLFPNNVSPGDLEDLLESIINPVNQPVLDCWTAYEKALSDLELPWRGGKPLTLPAKKTKIYAYLEVLLGASDSEKKLIKEANRDYRNTNHWHLGAESLSNLIKFIKDHLS